MREDREGHILPFSSPGGERCGGLMRSIRVHVVDSLLRPVIACTVKILEPGPQSMHPNLPMNSEMVAIRPKARLSSPDAS